MNIVRMILKEAGGRFENAAGSIDSKEYYKDINE